MSTETEIESVDAPKLAQQVDAEDGVAAHKRFSPRGIVNELKLVTWPSAKTVLSSLLAVIVLSGLLAVGVFFVDKAFSEFVLSFYSQVVDVTRTIKTLLTVAVLITGALTAYYALRHPSPGDTLASIFGGQITAQGTGTTPRMKRLSLKMLVSTVLFFASVLALGFFG